MPTPNPYKIPAGSAAPTALARWCASLATLWDRRVLSLLGFGFSAGIPLLLIFSSLSLWLSEAGVERKAVTFFSWAALGYAFKFIWAPLVDRLPLPVLTARLGRRRSWMLVSQAGVAVAIVGMAGTDPAQGSTALTQMAVFAVLLGFTAATQDIVIDAYRIECAPVEMQGTLSSAYIAGYRVGMVASGAGALFLAAYWGSTKEAYSYQAWHHTYWLMAALVGVGVLTTLLSPEPPRRATVATDGAPGHASGQHARLLAVFLASVCAFVAVFAWVGEAWAAWAPVAQEPLLGLAVEAVRLLLALVAAFGVGWGLVRLGVAQREQARRTWVEPVLDFFQRYGTRTAWLVLALVGLYRISDIVLGVISNVFYQDMGFSKPEIAFAVKTFGVAVSIVGSFAGGLVAARYGVMRTLMWGGVMAALTNLGFVALAHAGHHVPLMYAVVAADNLAAGFSSAAFVAFLSSLTNVSFTAVQYAIFSSLMTLLPKTLGGYSGGMVDAMGYPGFFWFTAGIGVPVLLLVWLAGRRLRVD